MAVKFTTNEPQTLRFPFGDAKEVQGDFGPQFMYTAEVDGQRDRLYASPTLHRKLQEVGLHPGQAVTITKVETEGNRRDWQVELAPRAQAPGFQPAAGTGVVHPRPAPARPAAQGAHDQSGPANGSGPSTGQRRAAVHVPTPGNGRPDTVTSAAPLRARASLAPATAPAPARLVPAASPSAEFVALTQGMQYCLGTAYEVWQGLPVDLALTPEDVRTVGITLFLECCRKGITPQAVDEDLPF